MCGSVFVVFIVVLMCLRWVSEFSGFSLVVVFFGVFIFRLVIVVLSFFISWL